VIEPLRRSRPRSNVFDVLPDLSFRQWQQLRERRTKLITEEQQTEREFNQVSARRESAVRADREALAAAIVAGASEPDDAGVRAVDAELEALRRRHQALGVGNRRPLRVPRAELERYLSPAGIPNHTEEN
jgi:hypothetical protein